MVVTSNIGITYRGGHKNNKRQKTSEGKEYYENLRSSTIIAHINRAIFYIYLPIAKAKKLVEQNHRISQNSFQTCFMLVESPILP